jgi:membrane fusion protein (multidrug efflux system)
LHITTGAVMPVSSRSTKAISVAWSFEFDKATQTTEVAVEFLNLDYLLRSDLNVTVQSSIRAK